jgi:hypothetical protein
MASIRLRAAIRHWDSSMLRCIRTWMPRASLAHLEQWAARVDVLAYALDDQTAIKVTGGEVSVVSEGHWKRFVL